MKNISILVADDEKEIADLVAIHLEKEGYDVIKVLDGQAAVQAIKSKSVDLAILDIMMPHMDGYEVTKYIREHSNIPIIFLSAKTSDFDKVKGLVIGADDYMTKPFAPIELVARVNAQLRRFTKLNQHQVNIDGEPSLEYRGLVISPDHRTVTLYNQNIKLTPKEFDILYLLASHPKKVFSVENIFQQVWEETYFEGANTVMVHIRTLRKKLDEGEHRDQWIKTVWGVGYTFDG